MNYFDDPNSKHFSFESFAEGLDENTFGVINFKGYEAISKTYDFEIMLVSSKKDIDLEDLLQAQAVFTIHRGENDDVLYNGILAEFDQLHEVNDVIFYRARLVPKLWWLTLTHHNQVFLDQSIPDIVEDALRDGGLETADLDVGALSGYEENSYVCQYDESHFNFVSRCLERQGIYYYFVQEDDGEVLTLTDTKFSHDALKEGSDLFYNPASGLEGKHLGEAIGSFTCRQKQLPAEIILKDYNYERPSLDITSRAEVDPVGRGVSYLYGEYFATAEDGERLAGIRAEELLCKKQEFFGESTVPYIMPGFTFNLNNHYREDFNQEYLILEITHEGNQSHLMSGGITTDSGKSLNQGIYHNSFKAIPNETQYRPDRVTEKPKISGTIHAKIDSEIEGEYAQIDEQGRYHVKLPFDINDEHMDGKGSAPVRMMQSYAGKKRGMQFPLVKGTEVLLTFIEGNPDRPVIAGAVSNPETQGPVSAENQSESVIQTGGNNKIRMEDKAGSERIVLDSPAANSWIRIGAHNDPITLNGEATIYVEEGDTSWSDPGATKHPDEGSASGLWNRTVNLNQSPVEPVRTSLDGTGDFTETEVIATAGIYKYTYTDGNDTAIRTVVVYEPGEEIHSTVIPDAEGIRIRSAGDLWLEAQSRYGEYHIGRPVITPKRTSTSNANQIGDLLDKFGATTNGYNPTGLLDFGDHGTHSAWDDTTLTTHAKTVSNTISNSHVRVSSLDTFNTQEGNIYDFGGYWNYNLGNSYAENHLNQNAKLNKKHSSETEDDWWLFAGRTTGAIVGIGMTAAASLIAKAIAAKVSVIASAQGGGGGAVAAGIVGTSAGIVAAITSGIGVIGGAIDLAGDANNIGDVVAGPGDGSGTNGDEIKTWARKVGSSFKADKVTQDSKQKYDANLGNKFLHFCEPKGYVDRPMIFDTTWVEKSFGDSYSFTKGNAIEITHGNKEEHVKGDVYEYKYGGAREETSFSGDGFKTHWARSANGHKHEINWDKITGECIGFNYSNSGHFSFELSMPTLPKLDISVALSTVNASASVSVGTDINLKLAAAMAVDFNFVAGFSAEFERKVGGELTWNEITGEKEFKAFGLKAAQAAEALDAKKKTLEMEKTETLIKKLAMEIVKSEMSVKQATMTVNTGQQIST